MYQEINQTGGARIGMANATWPFAKLTVNKDTLTLNAGILGKLVFNPSNIVSIEPYSGITVIGSGIQINHNVSGYNPKVIFWTFDNPLVLINKIKQTGFLDNANPGNYIPVADLSSTQKQGGFPIKPIAAVAIVVIWNVLFLYNFYVFFTSGNKAASPIGLGGQLALGFILITCLLLLTLEPFRRLVLKEGRSINDIKTIVYFIMLISAVMLAGTFLFRSMLSAYMIWVF
ncbi:hypothetical protein ACPPVU_08870 [Mucilaginibacter sp. McL0603]|uniref:hypothetical protein n=1 Tax=Mucilaginibacter sp. McL0603 TaxID=3415670 RepID=UPI003CF10E52